MSAARKLGDVGGEDDPVWAAFLRAPIDREPVPEHERRALSDPSTQIFTDGATISLEIQARSATETPRKARTSRSR